MIKHTAFMALSTFSRLLSAVVLFIILARFLGPRDFGILMYNFTLASIAVLLVEYGFSNQLLRDIGRYPDNINQLMGRVFLAKLYLTVVMGVCCLAGHYLFYTNDLDRAIFWILLLSCLLTSFGDFFNIAFRGIGKFHEETKVATIGSLLHFGLIVLMVINGAELLLISLGFVLSRFVYFILSWRAYKRVVGDLNTLSASPVAVLKALKAGFPYAVDAGFTNFFYQVDTMLVKYYLGATGVGIYQAGMRFLNGAMQFAPVLGNVFLPVIAAKHTNTREFVELAKKLNLQMLAVGTVCWAIFWFAGMHITEFVFGDEYVELNSIWPYIGLLVFTRYLAAPQGVLLTASGSQTIRVWAQIFALIILLISAPLLMKVIGLKGMVIALIITLLTLFLIFFSALRLRKIPTGFGGVNFTLTVIVFSLSIFLLVY
ncbi:oligosaccharide flippase family protein [Methylobacillus flagellatus]|uniref:Polysaccharide biosynthesis protein n=1 Tax=Methylobacillus flagellatus (strain ATCC 51484 / DSM 6875 / VKM B-1610 / KT) TaxID=265072 RepID=Q1GZP9_METFK|nr:oligosaccharide flippase family protein [Methylobacillus flagellatus]ABE50288.1 polysaccharide biosynthesis protein [Methylobacillus flagellatus KT]